MLYMILTVYRIRSTLIIYIIIYYTLSMLFYYVIYSMDTVDINVLYHYVAANHLLYDNLDYKLLMVKDTCIILK